MKIFNLENMIGGWFIGDFSPSVIKENGFEVGLKKYKSGTYEDKHVHKVSYEITVIVSGKVKMNNKEFSEGEIIYLEPGEAADFLALENTVTCVVKSPSRTKDKYFCN